MIRMYCITFGCSLSTDSCGARHRAARRNENIGRPLNGSAFEFGGECAGCATGKAASGGEPIATECRGPRKDAALYELDGKLLTSGQLAKRAECDPRTMETRLRRGCSPERAVLMGPGNLKARAKRYQVGDEWITIREGAERSGQRTETIRQRMTGQGMTLAEAMLVPRGKAPVHVVRKRGAA